MSSTDSTDKAGNGTQGKKPARSVPRNQIAVTRGGGLIIIRVLGAGNMLNAPALSEFTEQQVENGFRRFVFDFQSCQALDSTFMGCMVGLANNLRKESAADKPAAAPQTAQPAANEDDAKEEEIEELSPEEALAALKAQLSARAEAESKLSDTPFAVAVNASAEVRELLGILGVDKFVPLLGHLAFPELEMTELPNVEMTPDKRRIMILRAHENLVEIDKRNEAQFGAFLKSLSDELSKPRPSA